ncbi:methyltransferase domain-containing protein [Rhizobium sp. PL01]|jgi:SAM-dependent methyltransferase|uniref:methyltransferase domain-containing protein n=1 Tax=Rhizobium sp. PL01 TaxID=3085631 RepID=UPI002981ACA3|nr:methyltransferase domain-containing protein [Rhizobium sp. PL01]MDW5317244.1 methyltransferase domain-containing protein [Rhizobium sp. PL01]
MSLVQLRNHPELKDRLRKTLQSVGYETDDWVRVVMYRDSFAFIHTLGPEKLDTLEISGGVQWRREFKFRSYRTTEYPGFDICSQALPQQFDLIIADQIFEHLKWPMRAARNVYTMLRPGGYFVIATPFLLRVHASPIDCNRWTETGLSCLLQEAGFAEEDITTNSWGNRSCVLANFNRWQKAGFMGSLKNEPNFPVMVWAFARKPLHSTEQ